MNADGAGTRAIRIDVGGIALDGDLALPPRARAVVLFAHGSGSSRHSSRNRFVASVLHAAGFGTLLMDLLTEDEERVDDRTAELRFDIALLGDRVAAASEWLSSEPRTSTLPLGLFGASTGAAAALVSAARQRERVAAVVSRGGRPDLAGDALPAVRAPTLMIVGGADREVLELNRQAAARMSAGVELEIVPGASHLFEEPGALERVSQLARDWFVRHLDQGHAIDRGNGGQDAATETPLGG